MREATGEDLTALRELARAGLVHDRDADAIVDLLWSSAADGCRIVLEDADRRVIGFALGSLRPAREEQPATGHAELVVGARLGRVFRAFEKRIAA